MVRATFLEKSSYFNRESRLIRLLFAYSIFKNIEILSGQEVVQIKPNLVWSIPRVGRFWDEKMVRATFLEKSSYFNRESRLIRLLFAYSIFKNIEILSGQGCVQIKPDSAWSITSVIRMLNKKNFWYSLPRKKVSISYETFWISRKRNFKNRSFSSGHGVVQIK